MAILLSNFTPTGSFVTPAFTVEFDIVSTTADLIDILTLDVAFNTTFTSPAIIDGVGQDGYVVSATATEIDGDDGFHVSIAPSTLHRNNDVLVRVSVDTLAEAGVEVFDNQFNTAVYLGSFNLVNPLQGTGLVQSPEPNVGLTFTGQDNNVLFQLNDSGEPIITNRLPVVNSTTSLVNTNIQFSLHDSGNEGVNLSTLEVFVQGTQAMIGGAFIAPYSGSTSAGQIDGFDGFIIIIDPPVNFGFAELVDVRVVVDDLVADQAAINTLDTTYSFTTQILVDTEGGSAGSTQPPTGLDLDACIEFDWLDAPGGLGLDINTLNVTIIRELVVDCITDRVESEAVLLGVAQPGYELFFFAIEVGTQIGYHVIVCPEVPFNELEIITVEVGGDDSIGNSSESAFSISTKETTPPEILNFTPDDGDTGVDSETSVRFEMHDSAGTGVDPERLTLRIDNGEAVIEGIVQPGYNLSVNQALIEDQFSRQFDGYQFELTRDIAFTPAKDIGVEIDGYDAYGNFTNAVYNFIIAPDITPPTVIFDPPSGDTGRNRDQNITVDVTDQIGVSQTSVNISVQGNPAVTNGVRVAPFDVTISDIITNPGVIDGYRYFIDTELDFTFNELVTTAVSAVDVSGNTISTSSSFRTFSDVAGPALTDITPRDDQLEVSLRPEITFIARDAYDVLFDLTSVDIADTAAVRNGLVQSGFSMNLSRISGGVLGVDPGDGYAVIITPNEDFIYNQAVDVNITVFDKSQNNQTSETISWITVDPAPPIFDIVIEEGDTNVPVDTNIIIEVFDDGYKIDIGTLNLLIDDVPAIINNDVQEPLFIGTVDTLIDGYHYRIEIDPRFLLEGSITHSIEVDVQEPVSGNVGSARVTFTTEADPPNPKTIYVGTADGVQSKVASEIAVNVNATPLIDGYYVNDLHVRTLKQINRLLVGTRDHGALIYSTNFDFPTLFYSSGDEITRVYISPDHDGTIYLVNRTRERVDVYYNVLFDDIGRDTPDVFYAPSDGYTDGYAVPGMLDGYITDMAIDPSTSIVTGGSARIFLGTPVGAMRIDTDESDITHTEINGELTTYGVTNSGYDFDILDGNTNQVVALDVNTRLNYLYVATRSEDSNDANAVTYIRLLDNVFDGSIPEDRLIHRLINDINFQDD